MIYSSRSLEGAAEKMVEAAIPMHSTPSRLDRVANFEAAQASLAQHTIDTVFRATNQRGLESTAIIPLGVYATREVLYSLARTDKVGFSVAGRTADELQALSAFSKRRIDLNAGKPLGFAAELGIANMLWSGIADGELDLNYVVLLGRNGYEKDHNGLRGDVDLLVRTNGSGKQARKRLQIKASSKKAQYIYSDGITVVTAQDIVGTHTPTEAVSKLLKWDSVSPNLKTDVYRKFEARLGIGNTTQHSD